MTVYVRVRVRVHPQTPAAHLRPGLRRGRGIRRELLTVRRILVLIAHLVIWLPVVVVLVAVLATSVHPGTDNRGHHRPYPYGSPTLLPPPSLPDTSNP